MNLGWYFCVRVVLLSFIQIQLYSYSVYYVCPSSRVLEWMLQDEKPQQDADDVQTEVMNN